MDIFLSHSYILVFPPKSLFKLEFDGIFGMGWKVRHCREIIVFFPFSVQVIVNQSAPAGCAVTHVSDKCEVHVLLKVL